MSAALYNFSHPLTDANLEEINALMALREEGLNPLFTRADIVNIPTQIDLSEPIAPQIRKLIDENVDDFNCPHARVYVRLPGHADLAVLLVKYLNVSLFVNIIRLAPPKSTPTTYKVVEVIEL
jgi:hypothetical protein